MHDIHAFEEKKRTIAEEIYHQQLLLQTANCRFLEVQEWRFDDVTLKDLTLYSLQFSKKNILAICFLTFWA